MLGVLLLFANTPAWAIDLPDSARELIPAEWSSTPVPAPDADWVVAIGGDDLVQLVRQSNRVTSVATAEAQLGQTEGRALQSAAGFLPRLTGSASWQTGTPIGAFAAISDVNAMDQYSASANVTVPLSFWTAVPDQRAARADRLGAASSVRDARATAAIELAGAFFDVVQARQFLGVGRRCGPCRAGSCRQSAPTDRAAGPHPAHRAPRAHAPAAPESEAPPRAGARRADSPA